MPPKSKGSTSSSRSRLRSANDGQNDSEEESKEVQQEDGQDQPAPMDQVDPPPADLAGAQPPAGPAAGQPIAAIPPNQEQAPANQEMAAQPGAPYFLHVPTEKISTLTKNICKLGHGNFAAWQKAIDEIAYYRRWDKERLLNETFTWDQVEERDPLVNQQRRDAFWVLTSSMPMGSDFYHLRTGIKEGDANALYKKVIRIFLAKNPQNRGELRKQFHSLTMASTKLDVSRFAAKVVESATELRKIGAIVEDDEINTVFLDGLSRKFYEIVTVETVAQNDFDTMLSNIILHAKRHKLMSYRETSSHGYHHLAQEDKRQQHQARKSYDSRPAFKPQQNRPQKKKFFKKKERPSGQFKRWSANGAEFKSQDTRPPRPPQRQNFRSNNNREQKEPFMCMQQEVSPPKPQSVPEIGFEDQVKTMLLHELSPMRGKSIDQQKSLNDHSIYIKRLARECSQTREQVNNIIGVLNKERSLRRDLQYNFTKLHTQVAKLKSYTSVGQFHFVELASTKFKDYQIEDPEEGYRLEGLETTDDDLDDSEDIGQNYYTNSLPPELVDEYYPPIRPIPATHSNKMFSQCYSKGNENLVYYPSSSDSSSPTVAVSPPKEVPEPPRKTRKFSVNAASLLMSDTYEHKENHPEGEELWLADSGASYHTIFDEKDFDEGTIEKCDITVRIGDNNTVRLTKMGQCSRTTEEGRKVILTKVLLSPKCPTRILSVGKMTVGGKSLYTQDDSSIQLLQKETFELILKGTLTPHDTANVILFKEEPAIQLDSVATLDREELDRQHQKWGHLSFNKVRALMGLPKVKNVLEDSCNECWKAELKEPKRDKETTQRASLNLHRIHMDLTGVKANNLKGFRIALVMVDDRTRYTWVYPLQSRREWIGKVIWWVKMIQKQNPPYQVATFRTDSEPTIVNNSEWMDFLEDRGIVHEVAAPYSQFQNGVAERRIGLLNKSTKAMLYASGLPMADWYHAMEYAAYLLNRTFSNSFPSPDGYLSPYQVFYQGAPDYHPEGVFGCHVLAKIYVKGKMAPATAECIWLGKRDHIKADLVRKISTNKESWSRVNKKNPTIFPYLNCGKSRSSWATNQNALPPIEISSLAPADDWPESTNEISDSALQLRRPSSENKIYWCSRYF